ncbi:MAG: hypothetical protein OEZ03_14250 [Alphaproteobacteria bacterium]|nr:hypothetical protein [Alphaproteobacteria bacterium]
MDARFYKVAAVFLGMGAFAAILKDAAPYWLHLAVLVGGVWLMFRIWDAGGQDTDDPGDD